MEQKKIIKICDHIIEFGILAVIFFVPTYFAFAQENYNIFELNKLVVLRILLMLILLAYVAKIFIQGRLAYQGKAKIFCFLMLVLASFLLSTILSIHPQLSLWGSYARQQGFYSLIHYLLFFILLILNLKSWQQIRRAIITIMLASVLVCLYGLSQYFAFDPLDWKEKALYTGRIFSSLGQPNFLGQYLIMILPLSVFGLIFFCKKLISRFLASILILMQLACLLFTYSRAAWLGLIIGFTAFLVLFCAFGSCQRVRDVRSGRFIKRYKKAVLCLLIFGLLGVIFIAYFNVLKPHTFALPARINLAKRVQSVFNIESGSNKIRLYYWQAALTEFKQASWQRKLFGHGPETLSSVFIKYYRPVWGVHEKINSFPDRAHNVVFDILLQFGLVGLLMVILLYGYIVMTAIRCLQKSQTQLNASNARDYLRRQYWLVIVLLATLAGYFVNNLFSFSLTAGYVYLYLILAVLWLVVSQGGKAILSKQDEKKFYPGERGRNFPQIRGARECSKLNLSLLSIPSRWLIFLALFCVCGLFVYYQNISAMRADYYYMKVKQAEAKGDCRAVLDNMNKVVSSNPISTFYKERYIYHGLNCFEAVSSKQSQIDLYDNIIIQANSIGPYEYNFSTWTHVAHAKSLFGYYVNPVYYKAAEQDYQRLIKINPYITTTYKDLGRMKLWQKDYDSAIIYFKKAIEVAPPLDNPYLNKDHRQEIEAELVRLYEMLGMAYGYKKNWSQAMNYYQQALGLNPHYLRLYKKIADVYYEQSNLDKAIWHNKRGMMLNPDDYAWPLAIALLYQEIGDNKNALEYAEKALALEPENEQILDFLEKVN